MTVSFLVGMITAASAQQPPPVRSIGRIERISIDSLASAATALPMPGGRVLVNDMTSRRVLLFDSTLSKPLVIADSTSATGSAYGRQAGTLIAYHGDSALFIDIASLSMLVIGPTGKIERVMAIPRPDDAQFLIGSVFGTPGFDARGRLAYYGGNPGGTPMLGSGGRPGTPGKSPPFSLPDSAFIVRADLSARTLDTAASFKIPKVRTTRNRDAQGMLRSLEAVGLPTGFKSDSLVGLMNPNSNPDFQMQQELGLEFRPLP